MRYLNVGGPIALAALGAILYFAVDFEMAGLQISSVGFILMLAAAAWLLIGLVLMAMAGKRTTEVVETQSSTGSGGNKLNDGAGVEERTRTETSSGGNVVI